MEAVEVGLQIEEAGGGLVRLGGEQGVGRRPLDFEPAGTQALGQPAEVAGGADVVEGPHAQHQVDVVLLGLFQHQGEGLDQLLHIHFSDDAAPGRPAHGPGRSPVAALPRPDEAVGEHRRRTQPGGNLHGPNHGIEFLEKLGMPGHGLDVQVQQRQVVEGNPAAEHEQLAPIVGQALAHAVYVGIAHLGNRRHFRDGLEPDVLDPDVPGDLQFLVQGQLVRVPQLIDPHGQLEPVGGFPTSGPVRGLRQTRLRQQRRCQAGLQRPAHKSSAIVNHPCPPFLFLLSSIPF